MGWGSGSELMTQVIDATERTVTDTYQRYELYIELIRAFENHDCDTLDECLGVDVPFDDAWRYVQVAG